MPLFGPPDIAKLKAKGDIDGLMGALDHKEQRIRLDAAAALGDALRDHLLGLDVRTKAAEALGRLNDPVAVASLVAALKEDSQVARAASDALQRMGAPGVASELEEYRYTVGLRESDIEALRAEGDLDGLMRTIGGHRDPDVRRAAVAAIAALDHPRKAERLVEALRNDDGFVVRDAADALGRLGAEAVEPLIDALDPGRGAVPRWSGRGGEFVGEAARALGEIGDRRAVEALLFQLEYQDSEARVPNNEWAEYAAHEITYALGRIGDSRATAPLLSILEGGYVNYVHSAEVGLRDLHDPESVGPLIGLLQSDNLNVREAAARLLGTLSDQTAVEPLSRLLDDDYEQVRDAARTALESLGGTTAQPGLSE